MRKMPISCSLPSMRVVATHGSGMTLEGYDHLRFVVKMECHHGPGDTVERDVELVLNVKESAALISDLIGSLPIGWLTENRDNTHIDRTIKVLRSVGFVK